ncbi:zinc finger protein 692 isoform X8 [Zalophus californianus]|uniref:Zinc finger protein 692 n=1 Tax=Zalophus californianus TaxID=9704 RepID=A0A6J2DUQ7_ZALCA|nr:zinc finger protein 692 isoform X8 [Zalophus californianus]
MAAFSEKKRNRQQPLDGFGCLNRLCHCRSGKRGNGGLQRRYSLRMAAFSEKKRNRQQPLDGFGCLNRLCHCRSGKRGNGGLQRRYSLRMAAFSEKKRNRQQPLDGFGILWKEENGMCQKWDSNPRLYSETRTPAGKVLVPMASSSVDASRRRQEKRRQLDARRSKCRIRLGGHMEQWCLLKERLGFSLHSQLAKFLLDRYTSSGCVLCAGLESEHDERTQEARLPSREVGPLLETFPTPGEEREEEDEDEEEMLSDASPWTYSSSPDDSDPDAPRVLPSPVTHALEGETSPAPAAPLNPLAVPSSSTSSMGSGALLPTEVGAQPELRGTPQAAQQTEPLASPGSQAQSALTLAWEEDTAQIGPKRIRKAAKRELLPCDFPGCGRIFSNRQYLNHHKKYQHIHQKSFSCPEPACGKSFNFKKHLKEHVKLHSDTRDYICEFCARSFRTSSNLVIHRRIHTGEKPLQCEICGFTCRQKASLNWHRRKHAETAATLRFPCEFCGKRFEKPDSVAAHCSKSHPALLPAPQESPGPLEPCPSISASVTPRSGDESRPSVVPQALTVLPQQ